MINSPTLSPNLQLPQTLLCFEIVGEENSNQEINLLGLNDDEPEDLDFTVSWDKISLTMKGFLLNK